MKPHRLLFESLERRLLLDSVGFDAMPLESFSDGHLASTIGVAQLDGRDLMVEILFLVPQGANVSEVAAEALRNQGARPLESAQFTTTGLVWDQFSDGFGDNDFVVQNYNPKNDPTGGGGLTALLKSQSTWNNVGTSDFTFQYGGETNRWPSLVRESPGRQRLDGNNDVAWMKLNGPGTLGVTWYDTLADEADMALNTQFAWAVDGNNDFDVETVLLHENGHVIGLGHENDVPSVMATYYGGVQRTLFQDDIDGISALYPVVVGFDHDVAVTDVSAPSSVAHGETVTVDVTVENQGSNTETFSVTLTDDHDAVQIGSQSVTVGAGASTTIPFAWDTTGEDFVSHTLVAEAILAIDEDPADNSRSTDVIVTDPSAAVSISSVSPDEGDPGQRLAVTVWGDKFAVGATVDFGSRIAVQNVTFVSSTQLTVNIKIHRRATQGVRDVTVANPDGSSATLTDGFYIGTRPAAVVDSQAEGLDAMYLDIARFYYAQEQDSTSNARPKDKVKEVVDYLLEYL